ncbi:FAD-dependent oxidoreductase [Shimia abyssi]|uniref:Short chain enoyl-CoA hydratase /3-hydroxyacyl-CoA dehydrogenase n=1 Tax=Shimia abyssi TaxID=1662395 RepID=A0A2P8FAD4_9RHOB|nr:FAD-dependent oxidoreductase [Shimia abyssi]PSL18691.1 short chain enoyl-CoA hydratase /3-hydroxyacyl-CoA dehydrogenase [Shimia abyssi]
MPVTFRREGPAAFVEMDNPPVNAIGLEIRQGLMAALDWIESQMHLDRVIFSGKGRAFAAGADAKEFDAGPIAPHLPDIITRIERCETPWIAAIDGWALGGGAELVLGCHYRIASPTSLIGLPEVTLGVIPGAGGTQRLPRAVGLKTALEMIARGKPVAADKALAIGLVHEVAKDVIYAAEEVNAELLSTLPALADLPGPEADSDAVAEARAVAAIKTKGQIAPHRAIDLVALSTEQPFEQAIAVERETFVELRKGDQSKALRHIFFAERAAKVPDALKDMTVPELTHIAVVGGGTMGAGIAYALLNAGLRVTVLETSDEGVERAKTNVEKIIAASLKRGLINDTGAKDHRTRLTCSADYNAAAEAQLAIEAAFESMDVKKAIFTQLQAVMRPDAVLATNTSYLDVDEIAGVLDDPSRLLGLHFFAPAHVMRLLEIVKGEKTSELAVALGFALGKRLRKVPVLAGVCDGFIGNRILARYREAADTLLLEGALPDQVDAAMRDFGYAMGLYETNDLSGLDIGYANRRRQDENRDPHRRYVAIADKLVDAGRLGRKSGAGWYDYSDGLAVDPKVAELVAAESEAVGVARREISADEIVQTLMLAMINEAAVILHEGIAQSARDIDLVTVFGYGFPRWRGGLMCYADMLGPDAVLQGLERLAEQDPMVWTPSALIRECVANGTAFADAGSGTKG